MHPIFGSRERLLLYLGGWLLLALLFASIVVLSGGLEWIEALALTIPMAGMYAFICLAAFYICRAFPLPETSFLKLVAVFVVASSVSSSFWLLIVRGWVIVLSQVDWTRGLDARFRSMVPVVFGSGVLLYLLAVVVHYLILAFESSREVERHALQLETLAREAELRALKTQIHPHFLFNSLNAISALTTVDPGAAREMSLRLAEFLRKTLRLAATQMITVAEELALIDDYLAIEKARFGSRLSFKKDVDEDALRCTVPALLLQPLVENAIKHGVANTLEGGVISLEVRNRGGRLSLAVVNPRDPDSAAPTTNGVGLKNVSGRLSSLYGNEARLDTIATESTFCAEIVLPAHTQKSSIDLRTPGDVIPSEPRDLKTS